MHNRKILIIGEVYVDQHLDIIENGYSTSRLGGIFHAARSCDALNIEYALAYYAPDYLVKDVEKFGIDVLAKRLYILIAFILTGDIIFHCPMLKEYLRELL